jgi:hypothetical protein
MSDHELCYASFMFYAKVRNVTNFHEISRNFVVVKKSSKNFVYLLNIFAKKKMSANFFEKNGLDNIFEKKKQIFMSVLVSIFPFLKYYVKRHISLQP